MTNADNCTYLQLSLYEDVTEEDIRKTTYILNNHKRFLDITKNYEAITRPTLMLPVVPNNDKQAKYLFYGWITSVINSIISNIIDPHESLIAKLLFTEGKKYSAVRDYLAAGYKKDIHPIQVTAFAEKRRRVIRTIANSLKIIGVLDYVTYDSSGKLIFNFQYQTQ